METIDSSWHVVSSQVEREKKKSSLPSGAPSASLFFSSLIPLHDHDIPASSNKPVKMMLPGGERIVYYKRCTANYPPLLAQFEAAASASYRIVRGEKSSKSQPIIDDEGNVIGAISHEIKGFRGGVIENLSLEQLIKGGVADELVSRYIREEDDLHSGNMGCLDDGTIVGFDWDMSFYSVISETRGCRYVYFGPPPEEAFRITERDLNDFPNTIDFQPCYWPTRYPGNKNWNRSYRNLQQFRELSADGHFRYQRYFAFLKELLIDHPTHVQLLAQHFSTLEIIQAEFMKLQLLLKEKYEKLERTIISTTLFREFIIKNREILPRCLTHFQSFNLEIADGEIHFDLEKVTHRYFTIVKRCLLKDATSLLYDMGSQLSCNRSLKEEVDLLFQKVVDLFIQFEEEGEELQAIMDSFCSLEVGLVKWLREMATNNDLKVRDICRNIRKMMEQYRDLFFRDHNASWQSFIAFPNSGCAQLLPQQREEISSLIAKRLREWLRERESKEKIIAAVKDAFTAYKPLNLTTSYFGNINPIRYWRVREGDFELLIKHLEQDQDLTKPFFNFLTGGEWNRDSYLRGASANVLVVQKLALASLEDFIHQLSLHNLKNHELVQICFKIDQGEVNLQDYANEIFLCLYKS